MLKVLIVDDEESTRELLRISIDWEAIGYEVIGEAGNGEEALVMIDADMPDVVLTDIYMPYMDGLELSSRILKGYPDMKVVIVTGHDDFEYARRGIKIGVYDYITKPIDEVEIENTLSRLRLLVDEEREMKADYGRLKAQLSREMPVLKDKLFTDLLHGSISSEEYDARKQFIEWDVSTSFFQIYLIEIMPDEKSQLGNETADPYLCYMYIGSIKAMLEDIVGIEIFVDYTGNIVLMSHGRQHQIITERLDRILHRLKNQKGITACIGIGCEYEGYDHIKQSYKEAREALAYKVVAGMNQIISYDELMIRRKQRASKNDHIEEQLSVLIKSGRFPESKAIIDGSFDAMSSRSHIQLKAVRHRAVQLIMNINGAADDIGIETDDEPSSDETAYEDVFRAPSLPDIRSAVVLYADRICKAIQHEQASKQTNIIEEINDYIKEHMSDALSLANISEAFYLNKSYLSRIYKERTGMTLGEYILQYRMEQSKELIRRTNQKAYEIAEQVGYMDPNYFGSCFKKYTGMSISDYRKSVNQ